MRRYSVRGMQDFTRAAHDATRLSTVSKSWHFTPGARLPPYVLSTKWRCRQFGSPLTVTGHSRHLDRDTSGSNTIGKHLQVFVRDNNVDQALRALKRKLQREGVFRELKRRKAYEKPSERRNREKEKPSDERGRLPENRPSARG